MFRDRVLWIIPISIFVVLCFFTEGRYWADSHYYVEDVLNSLQGKQVVLLESSHLLWRPMFVVVSYVLHFLFGVTYSYQNIVLAMYFTCLISGVICVYLVYCIAKKVFQATSVTLPVFASSMFACSVTFLNYSQTATSYVFALSLFLLSVLISYPVDDRSVSWISMFFIALSLSISAAMWLPFIVCIPIVATMPMMVRGFSGKDFKFFVLIGVLCSSLLVVLFVGASYLNGCRDIDSVLRWFVSGGSGKGHPGILKAVFGIVNSFVEMGDFGKVVKKIIIDGVFTKRSMLEVLSWQMLVFALFYVVLFGAIFVIYFSKSKKVSVFLLISVIIFNLPVAIMFDAGSSERYLVIAPFFFLCVTDVLFSDNKRFAYSFMRCVIFLFLATCFYSSMQTLNAKQLHKEELLTLERLRDVSRYINKNDTIFVANYADPVFDIAKGMMTSPYRIYSNLPVSPITGVAIPKGASFKNILKIKIDKALLKGGNIYVSKRLLSDKPKQGWGWVDGDSISGSWSDVASIFKQYDYCSDTIDDGFYFLKNSSSSCIFDNSYIAKKLN